MLRHLLYIILLLMPVTVSAQTFDDYFTDETLRLDYIFAGNVNSQTIALSKLMRSSHWYGKRRNLTEVPVRGNGQIIVRDIEGKVIYRNSFSTLFQEWLSYDEAKTCSRSFENVFLMPMPKEKVVVGIELYDNRQETQVSVTDTISPKDILIREIGQQCIPYDVILKAKDDAKKINIAFVAEGYKESEMDVYLKDVNDAVNALFKHEPFKSCKDRFNVVAVKSASKDSGTSIPSENKWLDTTLGSSFSTFYSERYLTTLNLFRLHDVLSGVPYEHIIVLVNSEHYGGGGILNSYNLTSTHHRWYQPVIVHEFGHSFAGLADEYAYESEDIPMFPHDIEPWEQNITTRVDFNSKWSDLVTRDSHVSKRDTSVQVNKGSVGLYEGAGYSVKGIYRPCEDCRMRTNQHPEFCVVCQRAIRRVIDFYTE